MSVEPAFDVNEDRIKQASANILAVMDGPQVPWLLDKGHVDLGPASTFAIEAMVSAVLEPRDSPRRRRSRDHRVTRVRAPRATMLG